MSTQTALPSMLTQREVANYLHCNEHHITTMRKHGLIIGTRYGKRWMYLEEDIKDFIHKTYGKDFNNFKDLTPDAAVEEYLS